MILELVLGLALTGGFGLTPPLAGVAADPFVTVPIAPYATLNWSEWDDAINVPFGMQVRLGSNLSLQPMYDGHRSHMLGTWSNSRVSATVIWAWFETIGFAGSVGF